MLFIFTTGIFISCVEKTADMSIFGNIPVIYEDEILVITRKAQAQSDGNNEKMMRYMMDRADSVYRVAEKKSLPLVKDMIGKKILYTQEKGLGYNIKGDISVLQVELPQFKSNGGEQKIRVMFNAEFNNSSDTLYYIISDKDSIDYGFGYMSTGQKNKEQTVIANINAPNIPAKYQKHCEQVRFVTFDTFAKSVPHIRNAQRKWRDGYYEENHLNQESN